MAERLANDPSGVSGVVGQRMAARMTSVRSLTSVRRAADAILALPRLAKRIIAVALDAVLCALTVWIAF